ncbi:Guanine nucleotide-binding protein alpha-4 subunit [Psilocybe cubensis]|uniref:Guanine nucleotide-binding protein alpha-4 subunit n=1 Tax=Psilocybe cubensis TaxID=181762 RepID=A0ACB8HC36_PSICU|nr:Guanine nucleotide-binding protein alpha-4 subunit [Psilocybe cubensis]KAH9485212.1 Guanine nucleotide-binding protein alpha-4 subunit [Psilocybe cubensis]
MSKLFRRSLEEGDEDPIALALAPPGNETPLERQERLAAEAEARQRSEAIDEEINRQRMEKKKGPKCIRILLLGQSESGKSTTLKNFQLMNSPKAFRHERASWRAVVQLNVVRSVRLILDTITEAQAASNPSSPSSAMLAIPRQRTESIESGSVQIRFNPELLKLKMRLLPLQQVEEALLRKMTPAGSAEFEATHLSPATNLPYSSRAGKFKEIAINSTAQWKGAFGRLMATARASMDSAADIDFEDPKDPGVILHACAEDIIQLWNDPTVKELLKAKKIRLESMAGFFLDSIPRITALRYVPTDDDILRARLKTLGVSEHRFKLKSGQFYTIFGKMHIFSNGLYKEICYIMTGEYSMLAAHVPSEVSRLSVLHYALVLNLSVTEAWVPYFDDIDAIIFLAPISGFDEVLLEDPAVNKLEDSLLLWRRIVINPILKNTQLILFLNKTDLLKAKLDSGIQFGHYVTTYGNKPNDYESTSRYMRKKFSNIFTQNSPKSRLFYVHLTSMTDSKSTEKILMNVKDMVIRDMLQESSLL